MKARFSNQLTSIFLQKNFSLSTVIISLIITIQNSVIGIQSFLMTKVDFFIITKTGCCTKRLLLIGTLNFSAQGKFSNVSIAQVRKELLKMQQMNKVSTLFICCIGPFRNASEKRHTIGDVSKTNAKCFSAALFLAYAELSTFRLKHICNTKSSVYIGGAAGINERGSGGSKDHGCIRNHKRCAKLCVECTRKIRRHN